MPDAPAIAALPNDVSLCHQLINELFATVGALRSDNEQLQARLDWLVRQHFGRKSERVNPAQLLLFNEPPAEALPPPPPPPETEASGKRPGHGRRPKSKDLPRERTVIDVSVAEKQCPCCGAAKVCIGQDVTERHDYQPAKVFIRELVRPTYICRGCEQKGLDVQAVQASLPPEPIPRGSCTAGLLAYTLVSKYWDHLPLYRLEGMLGRLGWEVSRSTLCGQMMACAQLLTPLYELMCQRVRQSFALHTDDSPVTLLAPRRTAYAWVYVGDLLNPYTVFDLTPGHQHEYPEQFLHGYRGYLHADGYTGYNPLYAAGATHVGCWAHVRRKFFDAKDVAVASAHEALARIRSLYAVERMITEQGLTDAAMVAYRREHARPILDAFAQWLAEEVPKALPKQKIGEALVYAANQWPTLTRYLEDHRLTIDNNAAEQAIRPLAVGRRNWLHIAGDGGLKSAAVLLSIAASARRHAVKPWEYVKHLLTEMPARTAGTNLSDLLPDAWGQPSAATT